MPTTNEHSGSDVSQFEAVADAYSEAQPTGVIPGRHEPSVEGGRETETENRKQGVKRTSYDDSTENNVQTDLTCDVYQDTSPLKRSKVDDNPGDEDHTHPPGSDDVIAPPPPPVEDVETCVQRLNSEAIQLMNKWKESFLEGEAFESFCPSRVDALLKEALTLEENLKEQKDLLKNRLQHIARTLEALS